MRPDDAATLIYTSGTTGRPKGVISSYQGSFGAVFGQRRQTKALADKDRLCVSVPLGHMFGCICVALTGLLAGAALVLPGPVLSSRGYTKRPWAGKDCTALYGPPTLFLALMDLPQFQNRVRRAA